MAKTKEPISCKRAAQLLCESFERELSFSKKIALKTHLALCKTCVYCSRQLQALRAVFKNYDRAVCELPPPSCCCLSDESKQKMKDFLTQPSCSKKN